MSLGSQPDRRLAPEQKAPSPTPRDCIRAIGHPDRRRVLRILHEAGEARSPNEISDAIGTPLGHVSYHIKVLKDCGAVVLTDTQPRRGAIEHYYVSTTVRNELVTKLLEATRAEDGE
jgi:DNA-binding transcriptional ArsR family regulator